MPAPSPISEIKPVVVKGLFEYRPASSFKAIPAPPIKLADRLAVLGQDVAEALLTAVNEDRDNWGNREKVLSVPAEQREDAIETFYRQSRPLVGVQSVNVTPLGDIMATVQPTPYVIFRKLAKPGATAKELKLSTILGVSGVVIATDTNGERKLQVQARSNAKNFPNAGNLGCSPAGAFRFNYFNQGSIDEQRTRISEDPDNLPLMPIGDDDVIRAIRDEAKEELGIKDKETLKVNVIGYATGKVQGEILTRVESTQTVEEIDAQAKAKLETYRKTTTAIHPHDFIETYAWIPATPEAVKELILISPQSPGTHIANWLAIGSEFVRERDGARYVREWQNSVVSELEKKVTEMNIKVSEYYKRNKKAFLGKVHPAEKKVLDKFISDRKAEANEIASRTTEDQWNEEDRAYLMASRISDKMFPFTEEFFHAVEEKNPIALAINRYVNLVECTDDQFLTALAMLRGVIHTPSDDKFDTRRTPEAQGLLSAKSTIIALHKRVKVGLGTLNYL